MIGVIGMIGVIAVIGVSVTCAPPPGQGRRPASRDDSGVNRNSQHLLHLIARSEILYLRVGSGAEAGSA